MVVVLGFYGRGCVVRGGGGLSLEVEGAYVELARQNDVCGVALGSQSYPKE